MSEHHAGRAKPSSPHHTGTPKRVWLASIALPVLLAAPGIAFWIVPSPARDDIASVIERAGFDPLVPPSRLHGPGALYEVEGRSYRKVCDAAPDMLQGKVRTSPTENEIRQRLQSGGFSLGGEFLRTVNAKLGGKRVVSVEYRLTGTTVSEIPMSDLADIEDQLLRDKNCDVTVQRLLKEHHKVCPGYAVLGATTSYKVKVASKLQTGAAGRAPIVHAVRQTIEEQTKARVQPNDSDELTGEELFYGIQLSSLCITLDTATEPSVRSD